MNRWYARDLFIVGKNTLILNAGIVKGKVQFLMRFRRIFKPDSGDRMLNIRRGSRY